MNAESTHDLWKASDGSTFGRRIWRPASEPKAWAVAMHGLSCRADDFEPLAEELVKKGVALAAWNLRGQGLDPVEERRGAWLSVDAMLEDLAAFVAGLKAAHTPLFLVGESMGALLALRAAAREPWRSRIEGLLLLVPVVALAQRNPPWLKALLRMLAAALPKLRLKPSWFVHGSGAFPPLTRIPERQAHLESAPYRLGPLTLGFLVAMGDLIESAPETAARLKVPVAVFSVGRDVFVTSEQTREFFDHIPSRDKTLHVYPDSYHQLLFDLDAPDIARAAASWIEARLPTDTSRRAERNICR